MTTKRCHNGYRRCNKSKCRKISNHSKNTKRCRNGMRKCADGKCYNKTKRTKSSINKSYNLRNRRT